MDYSLDRILRGPSRHSGFSIVELMFGLVVIALMTAVLMGNLTAIYTSTRSHQDRVFAYATAQRILAELQGLVDAAGEESPVDLDAYEDGTRSVPTLTIAAESGSLVSPDHPHSRNIRRGDGWVWSRRINVRALPGTESRNLRYVTVSVGKRGLGGRSQQHASLSAVLNSKAGGFAASQVFDVYLLGIENVPGWWVNMEAMRSFVESTLMDLEVRNPGLVFRSHWITKASYGRNSIYRPYVNVAAESTDRVPEVYFYPGKLPAGGGISSYYAPDIIKARLQSDVGEFNGYDPSSNPHPYALADFFNHGMRLPRERAFHQKRIDVVVERKAAQLAARLAGDPEPPDLVDMSVEPTLRLLLEDLNTDPDRYRNAIVVNLHGELLPLPAIRNYSDPARLPRLSELQGIRVVTHPEELRTHRESDGSAGDDVTLRVYAFTADPVGHAGPGAMPEAHPIALRIMDMNLVDGAGPRLLPGVELHNLAGGVPVRGDDAYRPFGSAKADGDPTLASGEMYYRAEFVDLGAGRERFTAIYLHNTPVVAPPVGDRYGLVRGLFRDVRSRLYGLEYVPACTEPTRDFSRDLHASGAGPKNTARWRLRIPFSVFGDARFVDGLGRRYRPGGDVMLTVRTSILDRSLSDPWAAGSAFPVPVDPDNLSETYAWWADSATDVPATERYQLLGDPRHSPYRDSYHGDADFSDGYNPYHDNLVNGTENAAVDYPGLDASRLADLWDGRVRADVPRYFQLYRQGLVRAEAVFTTLTGFSFYYVGLGNEIGSDAANGYPDSLPMDLTAFGREGESGTVNNITPRELGGAATGGRRFVRDGSPAPGHWWGMPWLGELYPDRSYTSQWMAVDAEGNIRGNLLAGEGRGDRFFRQVEDRAYRSSRFRAFGTALLRSQQRTQETGCTAFMNIGSPRSTFHHQYRSGQMGALLSAGEELSTNYNLRLPSATSISRPFALDASRDGGLPPEFDLQPYRDARCRARVMREYYDHESGGLGSALLELQDPTVRGSAFLVMSGLDRTLEVGTSRLAQYATIAMVHSYLEAGEPSLTNRIPRPARVVIDSPTEVTELQNPALLPVEFHVEWRRWDGLPYTKAAGPSFTEDESELEYAVLYSGDGGWTWFHASDGAPAIPGVRPDAGHRIPDLIAGDEEFTWEVPASSFPEGPYLLRVEAFRNGRALHYSHHQVRVYIER